MIGSTSLLTRLLDNIREISILPHVTDDDKAPA